MTVKIVTDSTSDLAPEIIDELGITVVPLHVSIGNITYRDGVDLTTQEFYRRLAENKILPTTSAPSPQSFIDVFDRLTNETDEILCITISSKLSATYESASEGKRRWKGPARLEIIDSYSAIIGLGLITIADAKAARSGHSLDEIMEMTRKNISAYDTISRQFPAMGCPILLANSAIKAARIAVPTRIAPKIVTIVIVGSEILTYPERG